MHVNEGRIRVSAFGVNALTGSGTLLNLKFRVTGQAEKSKALILQSFIFNEETQLYSEHQQSIRR